MVWPAMIWIGGSPGAGKSTLARRLAGSNDLPLHPIDAWTYDHVGRMPPLPSLDSQLAAGPEVAAAGFAASSRSRLPLVLADVVARGLGDVPAVVEGPQLLPSLAGSLPRGFGVWLVTDAEQTRRARAQRAGRAGRLEALVRRDEILTDQIRRAASDAGLPAMTVPVDADWREVARAVEDVLAPALAKAPRLTPGARLSRQRGFENLTVARQLTLWAADADLAEPPTFDFACECGASGCQGRWPGTAAEYSARVADGPLLARGHTHLPFA